MSAPSDVNEIYLSSSPHVTLGRTTQSLMLAVIVALIPECVYGVILFGIPALVTILVSVASAVLFEALFQKLIKQPVTVNNLSAVVTGLLLAMVLPPTTAWWQTMLGALFAVVVAKGFFGGLGANVFNPALTGRAFLFVSFPTALGAAWLAPHAKTTVDAISSATVLAKVKSGEFAPTMNDVCTYFLGNRAGCLGETGVLLICISFLFLLLTKVIDWRAPLAMVATVAAATFITYTARGNDCSAALTQTLFALVSGGLAFGATFMVTDYATTPVTGKGRLVFGFGCGLITYLIRTFGGYPEGVMFSILIMNAIAPFLNGLTKKKYGYGKKPAAPKAGAAK